MQVVWKSILKRQGSTEVTVPVNSEVVHFAMQNGEPTIWYSFDPGDTGKTEPRTFEIVGTGQQTSDGMNHVGTLIDGAFVWHLFEKGYAVMLHGVWIPFTVRSNAEEALEIIRRKSERGLDGFCLASREGDFGVFLPFMTMQDSERAANAIEGRYGLHGLGVHASVNLEAKTIAITARSAKKDELKAFEKGLFARMMDRIFKKEGDL